MLPPGPQLPGGRPCRGDGPRCRSQSAHVLADTGSALCAPGYVMFVCFPPLSGPAGTQQVASDGLKEGKRERALTSHVSEHHFAACIGLSNESVIPKPSKPLERGISKSQPSRVFTEKKKIK